jgi:hypothetical protein
MKNAMIALCFLFVFCSEALSERVSENIVVLYNFKEGPGAVVIPDESGVEPTLDLKITNSSGVQWLEPGLRITEDVILKTDSFRTKLRGDLFFEKGITIEVWIRPENNRLSGPARILTFSKGSLNRNFTLGQTGDGYTVRFTTNLNDDNGTNPSLKTPEGVVSFNPSLQQVVYTRDINGIAKLYINKVKISEINVPGGDSKWDLSHGFALANEIGWPEDPDLNRAWRGDISLAAVYSSVLSEEEIVQNYEAQAPIKTERSLTFGWDDQPNANGYNLYYGKVSRFDPSLLPGRNTMIKEKCQIVEGESITERQQKCLDSWEEFCKCDEWKDWTTFDCEVPADIDDPLCQSVYFGYDTVIDVGKVSTYDLKNLPTGQFYFAITAYNTSEESKFSIEIPMIISDEIFKQKVDIKRPKNFVATLSYSNMR